MDDGDEESRFRVLFEMSPDAIFFFVDGVIEHANGAALRLLGAERLEQVVGLLSRDIIHPDTHREVERRTREVLKGVTVFSPLEEKYVRLDGSTVPVEVTASKVPHRSPKAFVVLVRDISARKAAEQREREQREALVAAAAAKQGERWLRKVIDLLPSHVYARDAAGTFVLANRALAEAYGTTPAALVGRNLREVHEARGAEAMLALDREVLELGAASLLAEEAIVDARGRTRALETSRLPFSFGEGTPDAVLGVATDITERKRMQLQLSQAQRLESLGRLAGGVAHDFNNLLTVILGSVDYMMEQGSGDAELSRVREAAVRAAALTRQLLAFARQSPFEMQVASLSELVARTARLLVRILGEDIGVELHLEPKGAMVRIDRGQMDQVLMNLAVNARDAMPKGGTLTFTTRTLPAGTGPAEVELCVTDTGVGMSAELMARIFEPFFTTKAVGEGTGLGLATCYGLVDQFGGRLDVESAVGVGTTFRITLPAVAVESVAPAPVRGGSARAAPSGDLTVLVIEDDRMVREVTVRMLRSFGMRILAAAQPSEAFELARGLIGPIDLILSDVVMPEMTGLEASRVLLAERPEARVLFVTGYSHEVLPPGAPRLSKPFTREELLAKIREVMSAEAAAEP